MGEWYQVAIVKAGGRSVASMLRPPAADLPEPATGWSAARTSGVAVEDLSDMLLAVASDRPALAYGVYDDSEVEILAAANAQIAARLNLPIHQAPGISRARELAAFANWSAEAPRLIKQDALDSLFRPSELADEQLAVLITALGFEISAEAYPTDFEWNAGETQPPSRLGLEECEALYAMMEFIDGELRTTETAVLLPGRGAGFYGVWDRDAGGEPVARFEKSDEGYRQMRAFTLTGWAQQSA